MNELQKLIEKWDKQIALHRRVCEDPLMYTKEDRLKNSHYAQAICAVVADLKKLTIPAVMHRFISQPIEIEKLMKEKLEHRTINDDFGWTGEWRMSAKDVLDVIIDLQNGA